MIIKRTKLAIIELSSSRVKFLIGPSKCGRFNPDSFRVYGEKTKTRELIEGGKMNLQKFRDRVLPVIENYLSMAANENTEISLCVATEWARECSNIKDVEKMLPFPIKILSGDEESGMALYAYTKTHRRDLGKYDYIVSIDSGSMSTEVNILGGDKLSVKNTEIWKLKRDFGWLKDENNVLLVIAVNMWNPKTGTPDTFKKGHDTDYPKDMLYSELYKTVNILGQQHDITANGCELIFGVYFKLLEGKI